MLEHTHEVNKYTMSDTKKKQHNQTLKDLFTGITTNKI